jgi:hypothetical protein
VSRLPRSLRGHLCGANPIPSRSGGQGGNLPGLRSLWQGARNLVYCDGCHDADLMLIGVAPGRQEDEQGKPFVGPDRQSYPRRPVLRRLRKRPRRAGHVCRTRRA